MKNSDIKAAWLETFESLLWGYHTCDWREGNANPNYPFQLASAYFDWEYDAWGNAIVPERTPEEAFERYKKTLEELANK